MGSVKTVLTADYADFHGSGGEAPGANERSERPVDARRFKPGSVDPTRSAVHNDLRTDIDPGKFAPMKNLFDISGKSVIITGASRGIGKSLAMHFRDAGAIVYGTGSRPESIEWMAGEKIEGRAFDTRDTDAMQALIDEISEKHGQLDVMINNAGVLADLPASRMDDEKIDQIIDVNYRSLFKACQLYHRKQRKKGGNIINVASVAGVLGLRMAAVYSGSKAAVVNMSRALAIEWGNSNFRVNALCPGFIDTDMTNAFKTRPEVLKAMEDSIPVKRLGQPEDLAGAAIFLASDASAYVTGATLLVDGGVSAGR